MDGRVNNGGARAGAGRKPKSDEVALVTKLKEFEDVALQKLREGVEKGNKDFIKIFFEYCYGKARQVIEMDGQLSLGNIPIDKWLDDNTSKEPVP